jgi:hypothetical protein
MGPDISLLCSQEPVVGSYDEADESSQNTLSFLNTSFNIIPLPVPLSFQN